MDNILKTMNPHISIVTPVYGCGAVLHELYHRLTETLSSICEDFEIILVNDASPDSAWEEIQYLAEQDSRIIGINLSRNFGQHSAITAGLDYAKGDWVVVMDCDLQDQPEEIIKLYQKAISGYDIVWGKRCQRQDTNLKKAGSILFYKIFDYFTDQKSDPSIANFGIHSTKVIQNFRKFKEQNRSFPLFIKWLGFHSTEIEIEHSTRPVGKSSYNLVKLLSLAFDGIISHSNKPLRLSIILGFLMSFLSILYGGYLIARFYVMDIGVEGWTSVMVSLYFLAGLILADMGILGVYLGKIFNETKNRPLYVVKEAVGRNLH